MLVASVLLGSLILFPIDQFASASGIYELTWLSVNDVTDLENKIEIERFVPLTTLIVLSLALNLTAIFLYKHRHLQMRLVGIACGIEVGLCAVLIFLSYINSNTLGANFHFAFSFLTPIAAAVLDILAYRRISDDEELIRSLDRLR
ncbi:MAG: DUF4293 domain-containing protein [Bacteroidales bacterium]|nr:DUF4293 domain-containing protein [Bacteroidales bacterium]